MVSLFDDHDSLVAHGKNVTVTPPLPKGGYPRLRNLNQASL